MYNISQIKFRIGYYKNIIIFVTLLIIIVILASINKKAYSVEEVSNKQNNARDISVIPEWKKYFPDKLKSLSDLNIVTKYKGENSVKCGVLLSWLAKERISPSELKKGIGGGDIDSGYIQTQIIKTTSENPDYNGLLKIISDNKINDSIKDAVIITLGKIGDASQEKELIRILKDSKDADYRALSAISLGYLGSKTAVPYLNEALKDKFHRKACNCVEGEYLEYTVKEAAETALRMINNESRKDKVKKLKKKYNEELEKEKDDNKTHNIQMDASVYYKNDKKKIQF